MLAAATIPATLAAFTRLPSPNHNHQQGRRDRPERRPRAASIWLPGVHRPLAAAGLPPQGHGARPVCWATSAPSVRAGSQLGAASDDLVGVAVNPPAQPGQRELDGGSFDGGLQALRADGGSGDVEPGVHHEQHRGGGAGVVEVGLRSVGRVELIDALDYCVLALLADEQRYGFDLVRTFASIEGMVIGVGTLYPLLSRLKKDGRVTTGASPTPDRRASTTRIGPRGAAL